MRNAGSNKGGEQRRRRAEALLQKYEKEETPLSLEAWRQLCHDLRVRQIELEIQNRELRETQLALVAAGHKYQDLYDFSPVGYLLLDRQQRILESNLTGSRILGAPRAALYQRPFSRYIQASHQQTFNQHFEPAISSPSPSACDLLMVRHNGTPFQAHVESMAVLDAAGACTQLRLALIDMTDRVRSKDADRARLEEQLHQAQRLETLGAMAGGIAHDFNNILAIIMGFTEVAQRQLCSETPAWNNLQEVLTTTRRAKDLVQQILAFSRQPSPERLPLRLNVLLRETLSMLRASLPVTIVIQSHVNTAADTVLANATQLQQVIMNLCSNADYAMRPSGGVLEFSLDAVELLPEAVGFSPGLQPKPYVRLTIRDTGAGIPPEILPRIFEPFFTTKSVGEGTGMGLAVAHGIIVSHGGMIKATSMVGKGTAFEIHLPRHAQVAAPQAAMVEPQPPSGQGRILFVDDEIGIVTATRLLLTDLGYEVSVYTRAEEALEAFRDHAAGFDLVIADQTMPKLTGKDLAVALRAIRPDIPIILCTGYSHLINDKEAAAQGINAFLLKPMDIYVLADTIQQVLRQARGDGRGEADALPASETSR